MVRKILLFLLFLASYSLARLFSTNSSSLQTKVVSACPNKNCSRFSDIGSNNLSRLNLQGYSFNDINLRSYKFYRANLENSKFNRSYLYDVNFIRANLKNAKFIKNPMILNTDFSEADLSGALFKGSLIQGAKFSGSTLTNASFEGSIIESTTFKCDMSNVSFKGSLIEDNVSFEGSSGALDLNGARLSATVTLPDGTVLDPATIEGCNGSCIIVDVGDGYQTLDSLKAKAQGLTEEISSILSKYGLKKYSNLGPSDMSNLVTEQLVIILDEGKTTKDIQNSILQNFDAAKSKGSTKSTEEALAEIGLNVDNIYEFIGFKDFEEGKAASISEILSKIDAKIKNLESSDKKAIDIDYVGLERQMKWMFRNKYQKDAYDDYVSRVNSGKKSRLISFEEAEAKANHLAEDMGKLLNYTIERDNIFKDVKEYALNSDINDSGFSSLDGFNDSAGFDTPGIQQLKENLKNVIESGASLDALKISIKTWAFEQGDNAANSYVRITYSDGTQQVYDSNGDLYTSTLPDDALVNDITFADSDDIDPIMMD